MSNQMTEMTDTAASNSTPATDTAAQEASAEQAATVAVEPEKYTCCVPDCGRQGTVDGFRVRDVKDLIQFVLKARATPSTERPVIMPELMAKYATCNECADKIRDMRGVAYYQLGRSLEWCRNFQQKIGAVAAVVGSSATPAVPANLDPEAAVEVACVVCDKRQARASAQIMGWWGAQLLAARHNEKSGLADHLTTNRMLLETEKSKSLVVCKDCQRIARPMMEDELNKLGFVKELSEEDRKREISRKLCPFSLMEAIRSARQLEARAAEANAAKAKAEADAAAAVAEKAKEVETRRATIADLFAIKAAQQNSQRDRGDRSKADRHDGKPKHRGRGWGNDD